MKKIRNWPFVYKIIIKVKSIFKIKKTKIDLLDKIADQPILISLVDQPTKYDPLKWFKPYVESLVENIDNLKPSEIPLTIGIFGDWGSGKSSFMLQTSSVLEEIYHYQVIWFNAWKYEKEENLWAALIQTVLSEIKIKGSFFVRIKNKISIWLIENNLRLGAGIIIRNSFLLMIRILIIGGFLYFLWSISFGDVYFDLAKNYSTADSLKINAETISNYESIIKIMLTILVGLLSSLLKLLNLFLVQN